MSRKGMALAKVAAGILILSLLIVLLVFLFKSGIKAASLAEDSECQSSILAHTTLIKALGDDVVPDITCPTKYYTITSTNQEKIKSYLAESLKSCWGTWGRGELELFKNEKTYCHICSVIDFKKKDMVINDFTGYLNSKKLQDGPFKGVTYAQYLGSAYVGDFDQVENTDIRFASSDNSMRTSETYATIFAYAKGESEARKLFSFLGSSTTNLGGKPGVVIGGGVYGAALLGIAGVLLCSTGIGCVAVAAAVGGGIGAGVTAIAGVPDELGSISVAVIKPYDADELRALGCTELPVKQDMHNDKLG